MSQPVNFNEYIRVEAFSHFFSPSALPKAVSNVTRVAENGQERCRPYGCYMCCPDKIWYDNLTSVRAEEMEYHGVEWDPTIRF